MSYRHYIRFIYLSVFTFTILPLYQCTSPDHSTVIASVGKYKISADEFKERYNNYLFATGVKDTRSLRHHILDQMVNSVVHLKIDDNSEIEHSPEYRQAVDLIRKEVLLTYYKSKEVYEKIQISEQELREAFVRVNEKISARHLFSESQEEANRLYDQLQQGMTFEQLAPLVFDDDQLSKNGGSLGYFTWGDMDPAFEQAAYEMKIGEISKPVRTGYGYSIIRVEDRIINPILTESEFAKKRGTVERLLRIRKSTQAEKDLIRNMIDKVGIRFEEDALQEMASLFAGPVGLKVIQGEAIESGSFPGKVVVHYQDGNLNMPTAFAAIQDLPVSVRRKIRSIDHLRSALKGIIVQQELLADAERKGYDQATEVSKKCDDWSKARLLQFKREKLFREIEIPDSLVYQYYLDHRQDFRSEEQIDLQEILVSSEPEAQKIMQMLKAGTLFGDLAKKYSLRPGAAAREGKLGLAPLSRYGNLKSRLAELPLHQLTGPIKVDEFYVIGRIIARVPATPLAYEEVSAAIRLILKQDTENTNFSRYTDKLKKNTTLVIQYALLDSIHLN